MANRMDFNLSLESAQGERQNSPSYFPMMAQDQDSGETSYASSLLLEEHVDGESGAKEKANFSFKEFPARARDILEVITDRPVGSVDVADILEAATSCVSRNEGSSDVISVSTESHGHNPTDQVKEGLNFVESRDLSMLGMLERDPSVTEQAVSELGNDGKEVKSRNKEESEALPVDKEISPTSQLEAEKKRLLAELDGGILDENLHSKLAAISNSDNKDEKGYRDKVYLKGVNARNASIGNSLKIEVIDDTALIDIITPWKGGKDVAGDPETSCYDKSFENKHCNLFENQANAKPRRRSKRNKKSKSGRNVGQREDSSNVFQLPKDFPKNESLSRIVYSRQELEALRYVMMSEQKNLWKGIRAGFGRQVVGEYNTLAASSKQKKTLSFNADNEPPILRKEDGYGVLGDEFSEVRDEGKEQSLYENSAGDHDASLGEVEYDEDDGDGDDQDYNSILKPAFAIEGDPDFDSGPPEDGFEYLRRVRWEAAQIPNVKVAEIDKIKHIQEQSVYMPQIPEIPRCPGHLLPTKDWEDEFLSGFSELRYVLSRLSEDGSWEIPPASLLAGHCQSDHFEKCYDTEIESTENIPLAIQKLFCKVSGGESRSDYQALSAILKMDYVGRVSMLRKRINSLMANSYLSRSDCLWLFALCASVDTPLDADTSASLRSLLRKCASIRAVRTELDDEVVMLNILTTISGRYFGQSDSV